MVIGEEIARVCPRLHVLVNQQETASDGKRLPHLHCDWCLYVQLYSLQMNVWKVCHVAQAQAEEIYATWDRGTSAKYCARTHGLRGGNIAPAPTISCVLFSVLLVRNDKDKLVFLTA